MKIAPRPADLRPGDATRTVAPAADQATAVRPARSPLPPPTSPARPRLPDELEDIAGAQGLDAALFAGARPSDILEDVLVRLLPTLDLDPDTRLLAMELLREELDTRQALDLQRAEAGAP